MIKRLLLVMAIISFFLAGWLSSEAYRIVSVTSEKQMPFGAETAQAGPSDHIKEAQIHVYDNKIILDVTGASWASFTDTHSMDPVLNKDSNSVEIKPQSEADVRVGDIISYKSDFADGLIIHRVIQAGYDSNGWYAVVQGDNNPTSDPGKVRFSQINGIVVAVIY
jgi:signal peptidase I